MQRAIIFDPTIVGKKHSEKLNIICQSAGAIKESTVPTGLPDWDDLKNEMLGDWDEMQNIWLLNFLPGSKNYAVEGDEIKDEETGADGMAIPVIKGDGPETAAGIAGDIMNMGKVKNLSALSGKLVTTDQKITDVVKGESDNVKDGHDIPVVETVINEEDITSDDQFKEYAMKMLKDAFGADFDEAVATKTADGLISKYSGDYGAMVGALQSTMGS